MTGPTILKYNPTGFMARVESRPEVIDEIENHVVAFVAARSADVDLFGLRLVVRESLNNAIQHGSQGHPDQTIDFFINLLSDRVEIKVEDQGPGFDWATALARDLIPMAHTGRGMMILKAYANRILYNQKGNSLTVFVNKGGAT